MISEISFTKGGPLVVQEDDEHWYLVGLISGPGCDVSGESVYTDMTQYVYWLSQVVEDGYGPTTTTPVTTGAPTGPCFTTGSCDATGEEHVGTVYGVDSAEDCQLKCEENLYDHGYCYHFTWYETEGKCRLFTECLPSGEMCPDCVKGPVICMTTQTPSTVPMPSTTTSIATTESTATAEPTTTIDPCYSRGSCDISGPEHTGTIYGVEDIVSCQAECANSDSCNFFTWLRDTDKCRLFSECLPSDDECQDCFTGPKNCP